VPEFGWTTQKVFHLMNFVVNGGNNAINAQLFIYSCGWGYYPPYSPIDSFFRFRRLRNKPTPHVPRVRQPTNQLTKRHHISAVRAVVFGFHVWVFFLPTRVIHSIFLCTLHMYQFSLTHF
jgi:hypothetical protein